MYRSPSICRRHPTSTERETLLRFAGGPAIRGTYRVRGGSSSLSAFQHRTPERLNFNIRLGRRLPFAPGIELKRFYLQNLEDDRLRFHNRTAYVLLRQLGLFHCYNRFVSLTIDATPVGAYLLVERPESAIRRLFPDTRLIVRRARPGGPAYTELFRADPGPAVSQPERLERALDQLRGEALVAALGRLIDLDGYLRWLAFNSFVKDADSVDEVFFFEVPSLGRQHAGVMAQVERELAPIDHGWPAGRSRRFRDRRARAMRDFERWLLERRAALLVFLPPAEAAG